MSLEQIRWLFFGFSGRISRMAYLLAALLMTVVLAFLLYRVAVAQEIDRAVEFWDVLFSAAILVSLWGQAALGIKRIHDLGRPGIFAVALFIPMLNALAFVALCLIPGDEGANSYGATTNAPA